MTALETSNVSVAACDNRLQCEPPSGGFFHGSALAHYRTEGKIRVIAQVGAHKDPRCPDVPNILDQAKSQDVRQSLKFLFLPLALGRPLVAPPEIPGDRLAVLRTATMETLKDPGFLADTRKVGIDIEPSGPEETAAFVTRLFPTPPAAVVRIQVALAQH